MMWCVRALPCEEGKQGRAKRRDLTKSCDKVLAALAAWCMEGTEHGDTVWCTDITSEAQRKVRDNRTE